MSDTFNLLAFINGNGLDYGYSPIVFQQVPQRHVEYIASLFLAQAESTICFYSARHIQCLMKDSYF